MIYAATVFLAVLLAATVRILPFTQAVRRISQTGRKAARTVASAGISDHWKEIVLLRYSRDLAAGAGLLFAALLGIAAIIFAADFLAASAGAPGLIAFLLTVKGFLVAALAASIYIVIQQFLGRSSSTKQDSDGYGLSARLLHRVALGNRVVAEASFDMEQIIGKYRSDLITGERHVFVCGLARAGTTVLMRRFYSSGAFRSLTYRDMPFVLAPNLWRRLSFGSQKRGEKTERAHGDGVMVDFDSPEALDEVFWRVFCSESYIHSDHLTPMVASEEDIERFRDYIAAILNARTSVTKRYLSKNNNNILRLAAIRKAFPEALIIIPFRKPLQHAGSLLRQHQRFCGEAGADSFVQGYMNWLGHHEFGLGHRPFQMTNATNPYPTDDLNHWLFIWRDVYRSLANTLPENNAIFVSYEALCTDRRVWNALAERAGISAEHDAFADDLKLSVSRVDWPYDEALLGDCEEFYELLCR